jgi:hypothetical protein
MAATQAKAKKPQNIDATNATAAGTTSMVKRAPAADPMTQPAQAKGTAANSDTLTSHMPSRKTTKLLNLLPLIHMTL